MRIFTAIPLPDHIKKTVGEIIKGRLPIPYVNTGNLHITLNFFGELTDEELNRVKTIFPSAAANHKPFSVEFDEVVKFRQQLHLTVRTNDDLRQLQKDLENKFKAAGFSFQERAYYPHVKLGNLHMDHVMNRERKVENFPNQELAKLNFIAEKIVLFESKLLLHHSHHYPILEQTLT